MAKVEPGVYLHHKGKKYLVLGTAKHSETLEELVVYVCLHENDESLLWVRPVEMFTQKVMVDGKLVPKFKKVKNC